MTCPQTFVSLFHKLSASYKIACNSLGYRIAEVFYQQKTKIIIYWIFLFHKLSLKRKILCNHAGYRITDEKDNQIESVLILFVWLHLTFIEQIKFVFYLCNFTKKRTPYIFVQRSFIDDVLLFTIFIRHFIHHFFNKLHHFVITYDSFYIMQFSVFLLNSTFSRLLSIYLSLHTWNI